MLWLCFFTVFRFKQIFKKEFGKNYEESRRIEKYNPRNNGPLRPSVMRAMGRSRGVDGTPVSEEKVTETVVCYGHP